MPLTIRAERKEQLNFTAEIRNLPARRYKGYLQTATDIAFVGRALRALRAGISTKSIA
jgi:hypothetical protein